MKITKQWLKIFLLAGIGYFLISCADRMQDNETNQDELPPTTDIMPESDRDMNNFNHTGTEQTRTGEQTMVEQQTCMETDPNYLTCRFNESLKVTEDATPRKDIEQYACVQAGKKNVIIILTEYFYPSATPKDALVCSISVDGKISGFAHFTQDFCRNNNKLNNRADSLSELLNYYQSNEMGYTCTKR